MRIALLVLLALVAGIGVGAQTRGQSAQSVTLRDGAGQCVEVSIRSEWPLLSMHNHAFMVAPSSGCK